MNNNNTLRIKVILGSTRPNRFSEKAAAWVRSQTPPQNVELEFLDLRDYPMPFYNEPITASQLKGKYSNEAAGRWAATVREADGFIIIAPEYNHGYPAVLKNALDYAYTEWNDKPVAFISYGSVGGARSVEQLRQVAVELQMVPIRSALHIPSPWELRDASGELKPGALDSYAPVLQGMLSQLAQWADVLRGKRSAVEAA